MTQMHHQPMTEHFNNRKRKGFVRVKLHSLSFILKETSISYHNPGTDCRHEGLRTGRAYSEWLPVCKRAMNWRNAILLSCRTHYIPCRKKRCWPGSPPSKACWSVLRLAPAKRSSPRLPCSRHCTAAL